MRIGVMTHLSDASIGPAGLAATVEERGFDSLFVTEHIHVPAEGEPTWWGGHSMPEEYKRLHDPLIALAAASSATSTLRLGTGVLVIAQREARMLAKQLASLDRFSGGRLIVGTGYGWLRAELADHGVRWSDRRAAWAEQVEALDALWTEPTPQYSGEHVNFGPCWSYPKPLQDPRPPILLGGMGTDQTFSDVLQFTSGWMPIEGTEPVAERSSRLREIAVERGRNPPLVIVYASSGDVATLDQYEAVGVDAVIVAIDSKDHTLRDLDRHGSLPERYHHRSSS